MAVDFLGALGAGSDIDSKNLVESLVQAERAPKESAINSRIAKSESQISAYGIVLAGLQSLEVAFNKLNDAKDFAEYTVSANGNTTTSGNSAYSIEATADAVPGIYSVDVTGIATTDRWGSDLRYDSLTTAINGGSNFTITHTDSSAATTTINVTDPTPQGVVDALNDADLGITASIVDTGLSVGGRYKIVVEGGLGSDNAFTLSTNAATGTTLDFGDSLQTASNATLTVNGVDVSRSSNTIDDLISGVTLQLTGETSGVSTISVTQSLSQVKDRIQELVDTYNAVNEQFASMADPESADDLGGVLSSDSAFGNVRNQVRSFFSDASSTATDNVSFLTEIGISFTKTGELELDSDLLDTMLDSNFDDIVSIFSADTNNQTTFGEANRGIAGDALVSLTSLMASDGPVRSRQTSLETKVSDYEEDLAELDRKMAQIYDRYLAQFTVMEQTIDRLNNTRDYLETALAGLPFTNKD